MRVGQRVVGFRDEHAFADGHRRVRNGALDVHRAEIGAEQFTVSGEIPACRNGYDECAFVSERAGDWFDDAFNLVRFDGDDDNVGRVCDFGSGAQRCGTNLRRGFLQFVVMRGARHDVSTVDCTCRDKSFGNGLCHVAVSDESDGWVGHGFSLLFPVPI